MHRRHRFSQPARAWVSPIRASAWRAACVWLALAGTAFALPSGWGMGQPAPRVQAAQDSAPSGQAALCRMAIAAAETGRRVPDGFLAAIARVESGRADPATGAIGAWPWTINAEGAGSYFATKAEAMDAVRTLQARGVRSIDVGCMQVNLMHHPEAFASLDQAFDPATNAAYAASFLVSLFAQTGSWPLAAAAYHSQTPTLGSAYQQRVLAEWATPVDRPAGRHRNAADGEALPYGATRSGTLFPVLAPPSAGAMQAPRSSPVVSFGRMGGTAAFTGPAPRPPVGSGRGLAAYRLLPTQMAVRSLPGRG